MYPTNLLDITVRFYTIRTDSGSRTTFTPLFGVSICEGFTKSEHILLPRDQGVVFGSVVPFVYTVYGVNGYKRWATRNCEPRASAYRLL